MKIKILRQKLAFTLIEVLVIIFLIVIIAALLIPAGSHPSKATTVMCRNNLKQLQLGLILFADDHGGKYPWQTSVTSGGSLELIDNLTYPHWLALSNYASRTKLFVCPTDKLKQTAPSFAEFGESNVSYFVNLDAVTNSAESVLAGDSPFAKQRRAGETGIIHHQNQRELEQRTARTKWIAWCFGVWRWTCTAYQTKSRNAFRLRSDAHESAAGSLNLWTG